MRRVSWIALTVGWLLAVLVLSACGSSGGDVTTTAAAPQTTSAPGTSDAPGDADAPTTLDGSQSGPATTQASLPVTTPPTVSAALGDAFDQTQKVWDLDITVGRPQPDPGEMFVPADKETVVMLVTIQNTASAPRPYDPLFFAAEDSQGNRYSSVNGTHMIENVPTLDSGDLAPGEIVQGHIGLQVPKGSTIVSVTFDASRIGGSGSATWQ